MATPHIPNPWIAERKKQGPHLTKHEHVGINGKLAVFITTIVGTMWVAYAFVLLAFVSLPAAIASHDPITIVSWIAQTFLQLVLLPIIIVGQNIQARASDKQAAQTFKDTETLLTLQDEVRKLIEINNKLTEEIYKVTVNSHKA